MDAAFDLIVKLLADCDPASAEGVKHVVLVDFVHGRSLFITGGCRVARGRAVDTPRAAGK